MSKLLKRSMSGDRKFNKMENLSFRGFWTKIVFDFVANSIIHNFRLHKPLVSVAKTETETDFLPKAQTNPNPILSLH